MKLMFCKRLILLSAAVVTACACVCAQNRDYMAEARQKFAAGEYSKAAELYRAEYVEYGTDTADKKELCIECFKLQKEGQGYEREGDNEKALLCFEQLIRLNPDDAEAASFLKKQYFGQAETKTTFESLGIEKVYDLDDNEMLFFLNPERPEMTYPEAVAFCRLLNVGGMTGWRLPDMEELLLYLNDYPSEKGKLLWVGYKGVEVNGKPADYYEKNTHRRYYPCIDGSNLVVDPVRINSRNKIVGGELKTRSFIPIKIK